MTDIETAQIESNTDATRKLVSIQSIKSISPIPDADAIEVAEVLGYKVVVKKGEFKVGDKCVFFEVDSILPVQPWSEFLKDKNDPSKPIRLKTIKLRKQISQGLALPLSILEYYGKILENKNGEKFLILKEE